MEIKGQKQEEVKMVRGGEGKGGTKTREKEEEGEMGDDGGRKKRGRGYEVQGRSKRTMCAHGRRKMMGGE